MSYWDIFIYEHAIKIPYSGPTFGVLEMSWVIWSRTSITTYISLTYVYLETKSPLNNCIFQTLADKTGGIDRLNKIIIIMQQPDSKACRSEIHGSPVSYVNLRVAHTLGMPGTFSPPPRISDPDMHQGTCLRHVPRCIPLSLTSCFLWRRRQGKCSRHSQCMRNPQFSVSGKRPMVSSWFRVLLLPCQQYTQILPPRDLWLFISFALKI